MIFLVVHSVQLLDHSPAILEDGRGGKSSNGSATRSKPGPVSELHFCTFVSGAVNLFWPYTVQFCKEEENQIANDCMEGVEGW